MATFNWVIEIAASPRSGDTAKDAYPVIRVAEALKVSILLLYVTPPIYNGYWKVTSEEGRDDEC